MQVEEIPTNCNIEFDSVEQQTISGVSDCASKVKNKNTVRHSNSWPCEQSLKLNTLFLSGGVADKLMKYVQEKDSKY